VISDTLDNLVDYQEGSLYVNNVLVDDSTIYDDLTKTLIYGTLLAGNSALTLKFEVKVIDLVYPSDTLIENFAVLTYDNKSENSRTVKARVKDPIPEPATIALLGTGLLGFFTLVWRRRRQKR
jgi:hypothetical protein